MFRPNRFVFGPIPMSLEDGEQMGLDYFVPAKCKLLRLRVQVSVEIAGTDDANISLFDSEDNSMDNGAAVVPAESTVNFKASPPEPTSHNVVEKDDFFRIRAEKTTPGGAVLVWVEYELVQ